MLTPLDEIYVLRSIASHLNDLNKVSIKLSTWQAIRKDIVEYQSSKELLKYLEGNRNGYLKPPKDLMSKILRELKDEIDYNNRVEYIAYHAEVATIYNAAIEKLKQIIKSNSEV